MRYVKLRFCLAVIALVSAGALSGCDTLFMRAEVPVSETLHPIAQEAQKAVNEANILITATANVVTENTKAGIFTKAEGQKYVERLTAYAKQVDEVQVLVKTGDFTNAKIRAELLRRALVALHREVASRARSPQ